MQPVPRGYENTKWPYMTLAIPEMLIKVEVSGQKSDNKYDPERNSALNSSVRLIHIHDDELRGSSFVRL